MKTILKWLNNSIVLTSLLVGALLATLISMGVKWELSKSDWGTWVGSVGTVLTFVGTIFLATSQQRKANRESNAIAVLAGARYFAEVVDLLSRVDDAISKLESQATIDQGENLFKMALDNVRPAEMWKDRDLAQLVPLPNQCALNLAHGLGSAIVSKALLEVALENPRVRTDHQFRYEVAQAILRHLHEAKRFLRKSGEQLSKSANQALNQN